MRPRTWEIMKTRIYFALKGPAIIFAVLAFWWASTWEMYRWFAALVAQNYAEAIVFFCVFVLTQCLYNEFYNYFIGDV